MVTVEELRMAFPELDMVDLERRPKTTVIRTGWVISPSTISLGSIVVRVVPVSVPLVDLAALLLGAAFCLMVLERCSWWRIPSSTGMDKDAEKGSGLHALACCSLIYGLGTPSSLQLLLLSRICSW